MLYVPSEIDEPNLYFEPVEDVSERLHVCVCIIFKFLAHRDPAHISTLAFTRVDYGKTYGPSDLLCTYMA